MIRPHVNMPANKPKRTLPKEQWLTNLQAEAQHWSGWFRDAASGANSEAAEDLAWRTTDQCDLREKEVFVPYLRPSCPPGSPARILDVGAGPLTWFPRKWMLRDFVVTPIDPLAGEFDKMLQQAKITPQYKTIPGEAESLSQQFPADNFHLVFCRNALEQCRDPLAAISEMLKVVKPNCWVLLLQEDQRTDEQTGRGPWTLEESDVDLFLSLGDERVDLAIEFADVATVRTLRSWHWPWLLAGLKKESLTPAQ
jgi:SAM-dependent methyltransferase